MGFSSSLKIFIDLFSGDVEFLFPNPILGSFEISSINDDSVKDLAKARHSAGKELIRLMWADLA